MNSTMFNILFLEMLISLYSFYILNAQSMLISSTADTLSSDTENSSPFLKSNKVSRNFSNENITISDRQKFIKNIGLNGPTHHYKESDGKYQSSLNLKILQAYLEKSKLVNLNLGRPSIQVVGDLKNLNNADLLSFLKAFMNGESRPITHYSSWNSDDDFRSNSSLKSESRKWEVVGLSPPTSVLASDDPTFRTTLPTYSFLAHFKLNIILLTTLDFVEKTIESCKKIQTFAAPHRDRFIFLGKTGHLLQLFKDPVMMDFKHKFGISDQGDILRDPPIFLGGSIELLSPLDETQDEILSNIPSLSSMDVHLLNGRLLRVAAAPIPPYITFSQDGEIDGGTHHIMLTNIGEKYNYTMDVDHHSVKGTGVFRNGTWNGMTGAVYYRTSDISNMMGGTVERYGVIDFITFQPDSVLFITRPPNSEVLWQAIFYPYTPETWLVILIAYVAVTITLYLQLYTTGEKNKTFHAIFIPYQITLDQGFDITVPSSVKFLTGLYMFFVIIISTGYRSDLISYYSVPIEEKIPRDFEALNARKDYTVKFNYHAGTAFQYFDSAKSGVIKNVRQRFDCESNTAICALNAALDPFSVCITWGLVIRPIISANLTLPGNFELKIVFSKPAVVFPIGFAFPKNSIFTDTFERITGQFRDAGLVQRLNNNVYYNFSVLGRNYMKFQRDHQGSQTAYHRLNEKRKESEEDSVLHMKNLTAVFAGLLGGLAISSVLYFGELSTFAILSRKEQTLSEHKYGAEFMKVALLKRKMVSWTKKFNGNISFPG